LKIAVTGGSGLVGRRILRVLAREHDVVNVDIRAPAEAIGTHVHCDILDEPALLRVISGVDAVIHAAAIPGPYLSTREEIMRVNVEGTENVALATRISGLRRLVFISSEAALGFVFSKGTTKPSYFPIDEAHPLSPVEVYGSSKLLAERALGHHITPDMTAVVLRPPWVWVPEEYERYQALTREPDEWWDGLWAYVHGDDLATAVARAVTDDIPAGRHTAYVVAPDNGTIFPTRALINKHYPGVPLRDEALPDFGSLISSDALKKLIGFKPRMSWRDFLG
jgi:nucleoside-diphosphate-sugar epimerase